MVALVGLEGELLLGLDALLLELLDLAGKDGRGVDGGVDAVGLDGDDNVAAGLEEVVRVEGDDAGLVGLRHVGKDDVDHAHEHAVLVGVARVLDDGDDVGALLGHVDEVAAGAVRELDGVDDARGAHNVGHVRHGRARGRAQVQHLLTGGDVDVVHAAEDAGRELGAERVPHAVLDLGAVRAVHGDALLAVDGLAGDQVARHQQVLLAARHKDARVPVRLDDDARAAPAAQSTTCAATCAPAAPAHGRATAATCGRAAPGAPASAKAPAAPFEAPAAPAKAPASTAPAASKSAASTTIT